MEANRIGRTLLAVGAGCVMAGSAVGQQYAFTGARATGMGGANAASVGDATAQWHNPAAFGFFGRSAFEGEAADNGRLSGQKFSWEIFGVGAGYAMTEDFGRYLDILADIDFDAFDAGTLSADPQNVGSLLSLAGIVANLGGGDALYADMAAGTSMQIGRFGIGLRLSGEAAAWAVPDTANLALDDFADAAALRAELDAAAASEGFPGAGYEFGTLTGPQQADLGGILGVAADSDTVKYLDAKLGALVAAGDLSASEVAGAVDLFGKLVPGGSGSLEDNRTVVVARGFGLAEIPLSYGWALNKNLSFGVTAKAMYGNVLGTKVWIFDEDNSEAISDTLDNRKGTLNAGLDLGLLYRIPNFQFALVGRNLNRPSFKGFTDTVEIEINGVRQTEAIDVPDVKVDPQVALGAAFMPSRRFTLEANYELLETGTLLPGYDIQRLAIGGEIDLWLLALRLGAYRNLAESWQDWVATAGVGLNLFGFRIDAGGAYSLGDSVEYEGNEIPAEARLYASIGLDF